MKGKVTEALAWGLPCVTTPAGAEGMDLVDGEEVLVATMRARSRRRWPASTATRPCGATCRSAARRWRGRASRGRPCADRWRRWWRSREVLRMIAGLVQILLFQGLGEIVARFFLPLIPGPVIGLVLLLAWLRVRGSVPAVRRPRRHRIQPEPRAAVRPRRGGRGDVLAAHPVARAGGRRGARRERGRHHGGDGAGAARHREGGEPE